MLGYRALTTTEQQALERFDRVLKKPLMLRLRPPGAVYPERSRRAQHERQGQKNQPVPFALPAPVAQVQVSPSTVSGQATRSGVEGLSTEFFSSLLEGGAWTVVLPQV
jgi:hypothetical protein